MKKKIIGFVCVHNSCRSQISEALGNKYRGADYIFKSGGTQLKDKINPDALRLMKDHYGIAMEETQYPKLIEDMGEIDILITMGCNVVCPNVPCQERYDWALDDPTGQGDEKFLETMDLILEKVMNL